MFSKLERSGGAGRGSGKRVLSTTTEAGGARPLIGAPGTVRSLSVARSMDVAVPGREESFRLERGELDFGAIIRLTPDIVKEIKRLEAQGGAAKIKFDEVVNNSAGNVVEVGGKEFRFTWSRELTDLCDIYEERQNGDDGDGLLVECGAAWRKLNVQRILDETTKNRVKMRSEEAERMLKSRKAIVLDPTNPSVKNQAKSMAAAAVEGNMRRMGWKHKKEMLSKKRRVENNHGAAALSQCKSVSKSATASAKGIPSPVPSPQQSQPRPLYSSPRTGKTQRLDSNLEAITPLLHINKDEIDISVKEMPTGVSGDSMQEINGYEEVRIDLQSTLINLLSQNPKGMSLKELEHAVGERVPNSMKKMENALKNIATLQTPGRYFLKQGPKVESSTRNYQGVSSPKCSKKQTKRTDLVLFEEAIVERLDQETQLSKNEDVMQGSEYTLDVDGKGRDDSVVRAGGSNGSGNDSDSDSTSSGSDSGSRSKARSGSASSSDSKSNGSSSSKELSDVDVDIMTSDDKKGVVPSMDKKTSRLSPRPRLWRSNGEYDIAINKSNQKTKGTSTLDSPDFENPYERVNSVSDTKILPIGSAKTFEKQDAKIAENIISYPLSKSRPSVVYADHNKITENQHEPPFGSFNNDKHKIVGVRHVKEDETLMKVGSEQLDSHESVTKINTKRSSNPEFLQEKSQNSKRMKASSSVEASFGKGESAHSSEVSRSLSPERSMQMDQKIMVSNNYQRDERREINLLDENLPRHGLFAAVGNTGRVQNSQDFRDHPNFATEQSGRKVVDSSLRKRIDIDKAVKYGESNGRANKHLQTMSVPQESDISALKYMQVDKISTLTEKQDENDEIQDKYHAKGAKEIIIGEKMSSSLDLVNIKSADGYANVKGNFHRREHSNLQLGEFRQPLTNVTREDKRSLETKSPFKKIENKVTVPDSKVDVSINKCDGTDISESKKQSADDSLNLSRHRASFVQPQSWQSSRMDVTEPEPMIHHNRCAESGGKNGSKTDQAMGAENDPSGPKKTDSSRTQKDDNRRGLIGHKNVKESESDKLNGWKRSAEQVTDGFATSNDINSRKNMEFSSDEENTPYMKYRKAELDLRGPIKDFSMYKDYVREFQEKYSHYCSLNKNLEKIRNDFLRVGNDLELARGRNMEEYYDIVEKLRQMYRYHGERYKEMKRTYILLHEELKTLKQRIKDFADLHSGQ